MSLQEHRHQSQQRVRLVGNPPVQLKQANLTRQARATDHREFVRFSMNSVVGNELGRRLGQLKQESDTQESPLIGEA